MGGKFYGKETFSTRQGGGDCREPYNPAAYYSLTAISWEDSPSPFALRDLAENGGNVFDYTRHIKSILFGDNFKDILAVATSMTQNEVMNTTPFASDIYTETESALSQLRQGTETIGKHGRGIVTSGRRITKMPTTSGRNKSGLTKAIGRWWKAHSRNSMEWNMP